MHSLWRFRCADQERKLNPKNNLSSKIRRACTADEPGCVTVSLMAPARKYPRKTPDSIRKPGNLRPVGIRIDDRSAKHRCGQRSIAKIEIPVKPPRPRRRQLQILPQLCRQFGKRPLCRRTAAELAVDGRCRRLSARDRAVNPLARQRIGETARIPSQKNPLLRLRCVSAPNPRNCPVTCSTRASPKRS